MQQPLNPASSPVQHFEVALSRVRTWKLIPVVLVPIVVLACIQEGRGVSPDAEVTSAYYQVGLTIMMAALLGWWLAVVPRPYSYSVRATMGRRLTLAGCKLVMVAALSLSCLRFLGIAKVGNLLRTASSGGVYVIKLTGIDPSHGVALALLVVVTPLVEEVVFRGALFRGWRVRWSPVVALLVSSAVFGALHPQGVGAFLLGATYALLYTRTRSLWASVLAHGLNNAMVAALGGLHYFWPSPRIVLDGPVAYGAFLLAALIGVGVWLHFVIGSWRTLGAPISPDSLPTASAASPAARPEALRVDSPLR